MWCKVNVFITMRLKKFIFHFSFFIFFTSCQPTPRPINRAFYHWKTNIASSDSEKKYIDSLNINQLYLRFFDIDIQDGAIVPLAVLQNPQKYTPTVPIIPTIFITNRTFQNLHIAKIPNFAAMVLAKITAITLQNGFPKPTEIQFDCDWTATTRAQYFVFLKEFHRQSHINLSATIRLHQIKFFEKTGVPPVQRGMLMFYNMSDVENMDTKNSILNITEGEKYLSRASEYPLELDVALPLFRWGAVFRNEELIKLIVGLEDVKLADNQLFKNKRNFDYELLQNTYFGGYYLYKGDVIRVESVSLSELSKAAQVVQASIKKNKALTVSFYHLDSTVINRFQCYDLEKIYHIFY
jgi:hypothetical protein